MMFGSKEDEIKNTIRMYRLHPNSIDWFWDDNGKEYYYAGYIYDILFSNRSPRLRKELEDMGINADDIYYLVRTGNDKRLQKIYDTLGSESKELSKKKGWRDMYDFSPYIQNGPARALINATKNGLNGEKISSTHPDIHANMNIYDIGGEGGASLAAQGAYGDKQTTLGKGFRPTAYQSYKAGKEMSKLQNQ